jgi:DNA-binding response OmpR family regulator
MSHTRILIVDDEATIRALLKCAVAGPGVDLFEADSAERALNSAAYQSPFDLVITDILMPGMDGVELAARMRDGGHAGKFLFMSGSFDMPALENRIRGFHSGFLAKPFSIPELVRMVRLLLGERNGEPQRTPSLERKRAAP